MLIEIQHKISSTDLPELIVQIEKCLSNVDDRLLEYFLKDCVMDLKGY